MSPLLFFPAKLLAAFLIDTLLGDPKRLPHPVRGIGRTIRLGEMLTRKLFRNESLAGILTVCLSVGLTWIVVHLSLVICDRVSPWLGTGVEIAWLYLGIAAKDLDQAGRRIHGALVSNNLPDARSCLGEIVGRDTALLDAAGISRATIESVAENTVDGIVSPLFFALIGGAPLMWAFKAISTCDSMIGYKSERYLHFGTLGARLDDLANFIPARICLLLFPVAASLCRESPASSWKVILRDRRLHASPNAGIPEAAMAGALRVRLAGPAWYEGELESKPFFAEEYTDPSAKDISKAIRMMWTVSLLFLCVGLMSRTLVEAWHG